MRVKIKCRCNRCEAKRQRIRRRTPEWKEWRKNYRKSELGRTSERKYRTSEGGRASKKSYKVRNREKVNAGRRLLYAISIGKIMRCPCQVCGDTNSQGHHDDYSKPLEVRWLCPQHHTEVHQLGGIPQR